MENVIQDIPDLIPKTFARVLSLLECEKDQFSWTLTKKLDGFSLVIKSNKVKRNVAAKRSDKVHKTKSRGEINVPVLDKECSTRDSAKINIPTLPRKTKHKSPSTRARDKVRRKQYRLRKKQLRWTANVDPPRLNAINTKDTSICEKTASVSNTVDTESSTQANLPACEQLHLEGCVLISTDSDSDDDSDYSVQDSVYIKTCALCKKPIETENTCPRCNNCSYCSTSCKEKDWTSWHKFACKPV